MKRSVMGFKINRTSLISAGILLLVIYHLLLSSQTQIEHDRNGVTNSPINSEMNGLEELVAQQQAGDGENGADIPFMPQMGNETLKAELGNAAWKLFHTILARYPEEPTQRQRRHLETYIQSFAQVYPCGDCARHFIKLLEEFPPQTNSRKNAAMWGCFIHNKVNRRLGKDLYDCTTVLEDYDCGCGADELQQSASSQHGAHGLSSGPSTADLPSTPEPPTPDLGETRVHLDSIRVESSQNHVGG